MNALPVDNIALVSVRESPIIVNVIASSAELNCCGIYLYFMTVGGNL